MGELKVEHKTKNSLTKIKKTNLNKSEKINDLQKY